MKRRRLRAGVTRSFFILTLALFVLLLVREVRAHDVQAGVLLVREISTQRYSVDWFAPVWGSERPLGLEPRFPEHCRREGPLLECGVRGLDGTLSISGIERSPAQVVVRIERASGQTLTATLNSSRPELEVSGLSSGSSSGFPATAALAKSYLGLGFEHILTGVDHLLFVLGLMLLVGFGKKLIWTITAFTVAHSVTLAASVLGWVELPPAPVEAAIALSILLLAVELARSHPSLTRRMPWLVAFIFGLLHGFGFAGALSEIGLPEEHRALSLVTFNLGVELGQLLVIGAVGVLARPLWLNRPHWRRRLEPLFIYALGTLAAFWFFDRASGIFAQTDAEESPSSMQAAVR